MDKSKEMVVVMADEAPDLQNEEEQELLGEMFGDTVVSLADSGIGQMPMLILLWDNAESRETLKKYMTDKHSPLWLYVNGESFNDFPSLEDTLQ